MHFICVFSCLYTWMCIMHESGTAEPFLQFLDEIFCSLHHSKGQAILFTHVCACMCRYKCVRGRHPLRHGLLLALSHQLGKTSWPASTRLHLQGLGLQGVTATPRLLCRHWDQLSPWPRLYSISSWGDKRKEKSSHLSLFG